MKIKEETQYYLLTGDGKGDKLKFPVPYQPAYLMNNIADEECLLPGVQEGEYVLVYVAVEDYPDDPFRENDQGELRPLEVCRLGELDYDRDEWNQDGYIQYLCGACLERIYGWIVPGEGQLYDCGPIGSLNDDARVTHAYIIPADVPLDKREAYAKGMAETYRAYLNGDVYMIAVCEYSPHGPLKQIILVMSEEGPESGYYGDESAMIALKEKVAEMRKALMLLPSPPEFRPLVQITDSQGKPLPVVDKKGEV